MRNEQLGLLVACVGLASAAVGCSNATTDVTAAESAQYGSRVVVSVVDADGQAQANVTVTAEDLFGRLAAVDATDGTGHALFFLERGSFRFAVGKSYRHHTFKPPCGSTPFFSGNAGSCTVPGCRAAKIVIACPGSGPCAGKADGAACDDGNACTSNDSCQAGACAGTPVVCTAQDQCHDAGTCDAATGACSNPSKTDGASCDDGDLCTQSDSCQAGVCTAGSPVVCQASDQCHDAGTCDRSTGACSNPAKADGSACDDGDFCTQTDSCQIGACVGSNPVICVAADQCHVAGSCDPTSGACSNPATFEGASCNDGDACTQIDACLAGLCVGSNPATCAALDQCHVAGSCDSSTGACSNPVAGNGTSCSDGNACTRADSCQGGTCVGASPVTCLAADPCHDPGVCNPANGVCSDQPKANGTACSDGNACTQADSCQGGTCVGASPVTCLALDACHVAGTCDPASGRCSSPAADNGTTCDDGNACTRADACQAGACVGGNPVTCVAADQCHATGMCDPATGVCSNPAATDGTACNDGNSCTLADTCQGGACNGSSPVVCAALDQCHLAGACDPLTGQCANPPKADGETCVDESSCTQVDSCQGGVCVGSAPAVSGAACSGQCQATSSNLGLIDWVDWITAANNAASGQAGQVELSYTGDMNPEPITGGSGSLWLVGGSSYMHLPEVENPPVAADMIRLTGGPSLVMTVKFSRTVVNPVMAILSLGRAGIPAQFDFDAPFVVLNSGLGFFGDGALTALPGDVLEGAEGNGIIQFTGAFDAISWTMPIAEFWAGFTFGIHETVTAPCATGVSCSGRGTCSGGNDCVCLPQISSN